MVRGVVLAALASCSGEDTSGGPNVPIQMFDDASREASCVHLVTCGMFPDQATCVAMATPVPPYLVTPDVERAVLAGKMYYDGGRAAACFAAMAKVTCDSTDEDGRVPIPACANILRGAVAADAECAFDSECISQVCANNCGELSCCMGRCNGGTAPVAVLKSVGQSCVQERCVANAYCDANTQICSALKSANTPCSASTECAYGLGCVPGSPTVCTTMPTLGQPCPPFVSPRCRDEGQYCNATTQICTALGLPGDPCDPGNGDSNGGCAHAFRCDSTTLKCAPYSATGETCVNLFRCAAVADECNPVTNVCTRMSIEGESCAASMSCTNDFFCDATQHCAAFPPCI